MRCSAFGLLDYSAFGIQLGRLAGEAHVIDDSRGSEALQRENAILHTDLMLGTHNHVVQVASKRLCSAEFRASGERNGP